MAEDFCNGLSIVKLDAVSSDLSIIVETPEHPWRDLYQKRRMEAPDSSSEPPSTVRAPIKYTEHSQLCGPLGSEDPGGYYRKTMPQEVVRLSDVQAFRSSTAKKALADISDYDLMNGLSVVFSTLSTSTSISSTSRPVIYRYIDVIKSSMALLEAIHFEIFLPDRPDLRFLSIPFASLPDGTVERDFFRVTDAELLPEPAFSVKFGDMKYPVMWEASQIDKMQFDRKQEEIEDEGMAYVVKRKGNVRGGEAAVSTTYDRDFVIREHLFPDEDSRREGSLVHVTMKSMATAHIYPVEPPLPPPYPTEETMMNGVEKAAVKEESSSESEEAAKANGNGMARDKSKFDGLSEYLKRVFDVQTYSQRVGRVVTAVRALEETVAIRIEDRLGGFTTYGDPGDLKLMDELFRLGSRFRVSVSKGADTKEVGETKIDESIILQTITDQGIGPLSECRSLLDCIYGKRGAEVDDDDENRLEPQTTSFRDGTILTLNTAQAKAVRLYSNDQGPRVFCILSPPGSGKTTVAAAMAAEVARHMREQKRLRRAGRGGFRGEAKEEGYYSSVQLLLSVQNVAVDNMGAALQKMDYGGGTIYNMKSSKKLNFQDPAPYDFFDLMDDEELGKWKNGKIVETTVLKEKKDKEKEKEAKNNKKNKKEDEKKKRLEDCITHHRREFEKTVTPKIILSTVEMALQKIYTDSKLVSDLGRVRKKIIIDEASLLTEAALYCIIRRFPQARIVLIGDDKQLPPFMYDSKILGHELAGRPALTVAMKTGRVPVVELNEVYRAPPSLIEPYNRLAYGGRLISRKAEVEFPLSVLGLIHQGLPQLLLVDVDGKEMRNEKSMSLSNEKELKALMRLLNMFPAGWNKEIMIICLYKDQKKRLQSILDKEKKQYSVLTVDSAQGKEKPIVILMTTRTQKATDFFCSTERCNVAVSRQQKALIILGKAPLLTTNKPWSTVVNGDDFTRINADDIK